MSGADFESLRAAHVEMLLGSLLDGTQLAPNGGAYAWSRTVPDPALNFGYGVRDAADFAWAGAFALGRGRSPTFLARDGDEVSYLSGFFEPAAIRVASWMTVELRHAPRGAAPGSERVACYASACPPPDFEAVLINLSDAAAVRAHLRRHYLPALRAARARPGIVPLHLVLYDAAGPASCASLYLRGDRAGLYNLSTRADRQHRGRGSRLLLAALEAARTRGARSVFLPCEAGTAVETLAMRHGFRVAYRPRFVSAGPT